MMKGNRMLFRMSQFAVAAAAVSFSCFLLNAQTQPIAAVGGFNTPFSTPEAPVGTTFQTKEGDTTVESPDSRVTPNVDVNYRIGADDVLTVNVWHEPEVSRNVPVRPDGKISLPLVGDVQAAGMTPTQLKTELETRFAKFLTNPDVSVIVAEIRSQRINVLGQVFRPGTYALIPPMSVIDAVATAGGLREFAKPNKIYVLRTLPTGQVERIKVQYNNVLKGKHGTQDVMLQTRDTVVIP
jgi:polysaccharide export outer membrane protein